MASYKTQCQRGSLSIPDTVHWMLFVKRYLAFSQACVWLWLLQVSVEINV